MPLPRFHIEGHVYFITTVTYGRVPLFTRPSFILPLLDSLNYYRHAHAFRLLGYVIMPDHIHLLIWPDQASEVADLMRDYKKFTAVRLIRQAQAEQCADLLAAFTEAGETTGRSQRKVWQDSYWDVNVYSDRFLREKLDYIHRNPIRAGLVEQPEEYPYSSYRNYVNHDQSLIEVDMDWF